MGHFEFDVCGKLHYLYASDGLFAIYVMNGENDTMYYVHKDHLGSFDVVTDEEGNVMERYSFDPWGRRRNPVDGSFNNVPTPRLFDRGYTGHEHLDIFGLINMNGRVYDPWLSRFLSPDPFVQTPTHSQSFNRYSYCLNNPLKYTDPSGYKQKPFFEWEMNYSNSGASMVFTGPDIGSLSIPGSMGYTYVGNNEYIDKATGKTVNFETVFNNYILPAQNKESGNSESTDIVNLYFPRQTPVLTNIFIPGAIKWNVDGSNWYVFGFTTIYTSRTHEVGAVQGEGGGWIDPALNTIGGLTLANKGREVIEWEYLRQAKFNRSLSGNFSQPVKHSLRAIKSTGRALGYAGVALSGVDMAVNGINVSNSLDLVMGGVAFIPGVGWAISGTYFIANITTQLITNKSIGEHIQGQFTNHNATYKPW